MFMVQATQTDPFVEKLLCATPSLGKINCTFYSASDSYTVVPRETLAAAAGSNNMLLPRCRRTRVMPRVLRAPLLGAWPHRRLTALPGTSADGLGQAHADALASPPLPLGGPTAFGHA
jgi:hypothetical protein